MPSFPPPDSYIIQPAVDAAVARTDNEHLCIRWTAVADSVHIYAGDTPATINYPLLSKTVNGSQLAMIPLWDTAVQPAFQLHFVGGPADGERLVVAERTLNLQHGVNFRDIGGYRTDDGRTVRWGRVYRSGFLANLTAGDMALLAKLNFQVVCDFRSKLEAKLLPDRLPEKPQPAYLSLPAMSTASRWRQALAVFRRRDQLDELLLHGYTTVMLQENVGLIGDVLRRLADPTNLPLVVHCTAGKDRTGVLIALLLALLGVPDETIIADYSLSNAHFGEYAPTLQKDIRRLTRLGLSEKQVRPFLIADPALMRATLAFLRREFGSPEAYARDMAGIDDKTLSQIRNNLLAEHSTRPSP